MPTRPRQPADETPWPGVVPTPWAAAALRQLLAPGERVLWWGRPDPLVALRSQIPLFWVGGPLAALGAILWICGLLPDGFGAVPLIIGGTVLAAPFLTAVVATGTVYAVTDRRAVIRRNAIGIDDCVSIALAQVDDEAEILTVAGGGHVYFGRARRDAAEADHTGRIAFRSLAKPHEAAQALARARARAAWRTTHG
jgi:hypothetical protein